MTTADEILREAWLEDRRSCITGTQISAILGLNHHISPIDVWAEKVGIDIPFEVNDAMRAGKRFERSILDETAERVGRDLIYADPFELIRVPGFPLMGATLDARWADTGSPVDAKNMRFKEASVWGEEGTDAIPDSYKLQLQVQMMAVDAESANLAVCFSGQDFFLYDVQRDREMDELLKDEVTAWWNKHIVLGVQPDADGSESFTHYLKARFSRNRLDLIPATDELRDAVFRLQAIKSDLAEMEKRKEYAEQVLKLAIGEHEGIEGLCSWKCNRDSEKTDWKAVASHFASDPSFANVVDRHTVPVPGARVLRLK